jgi:hypothetical protein
VGLRCIGLNKRSDDGVAVERFYIEKAGFKKGPVEMRTLNKTTKITVQEFPVI